MVYVCVHETEVHMRGLPPSLPTLYFETGSLTESVAQWLAREQGFPLSLYFSTCVTHAKAVDNYVWEFELMSQWVYN